MRRVTIVTILLFSSLPIISASQTKPLVAPADYGQWETLGPTSLSPDGKWLAYGINRSNRNNELRITGVAGGEPKVAAFGSQPIFSSDSRWVAYGISYSEAQEEKLRKEKKPIHRKMGALNLSSGEQVVVDGVESFAFSANGAFLAMRRYAPERKDAPAPDPTVEADAPPGATLIVRQLASGRDTTFGNVAEFAWQDLPHRGRLLALTISAEDKTGNGVQLYDPETGALRVLDSSSSTYSGLTWRKESADLAVLRSMTDVRHEGPAHVALAWTRLTDESGAGHVYDPPTDSKFPAGPRTVAFRKPSWSDDGRVVFLGVANWNEKAADSKKTTTAADGAGTGPVAKNETSTSKDAAKDEDEPPAVDVWHSRDVDVMPKQKINA